MNQIFLYTKAGFLNNHKYTYIRWKHVFRKWNLNVNEMIVIQPRDENAIKQGDIWLVLLVFQEDGVVEI